MKNLLLLSVLVILAAAEINAQNGGINFMVGFPQGEFKKNVDRAGVGLNAQFLLWTPNSQMPASAGLNIGFMNYGSETRTEPFSTTIPDVMVDVSRSNNLVNFHFMFQISPFEGPVKPYAEALFGGAYLFTSTEIKSQGHYNDEVASTTNFSDWAWSYGGGGGFLIKLYENEKTKEEGEMKLSSLWLDLKARYLFGSEASYLKEGSVEIFNGRAYYQESRSKTDLFSIHLGVVAEF